MTRNPLSLILLVELASLFLLGVSFGFLIFILEIAVSAMIGYALIKRSGQSLLNSTRTVQGLRVANFRSAPKPLINLLAGLCLIMPGLLTDLLGALIVLWATINLSSPQQKPSQSDHVIEGEFESVAETKPTLGESKSEN